MKGFVTLATGNIRFKKLAHNLKRSYDYQNQGVTYPWAVVTDKYDDLLSIFDKIVILPHATCSYLDKISILSLPPWDENVFVDADSLVYGDISFLFNYFPINGVKHVGDYLPLSAKGKGWFDVEDIGIYGQQITFKIHSHGGIFFFNNSKKTTKIYQTCLEIATHWSELKFREFSSPADEPIMALSMAINDCPPIEDNMDNYLCFYRVQKNILKINISKGVLSYINKWDKKKYENVSIVHWGNLETKGYLYKSEVLNLDGNKYWTYYKIYWMIQDYFKSKIGIIKSYIYKKISKTN